MYEIKKKAEDFLVEEITLENKVLGIGKNYKFKKTSKGEQTICILEKKNWDTIGATKELAKRLRVSKSRIGFAGTKDRRAVSTQRISLWKCPIDIIEEVNIKDIEIKPLHYSDERIKLGDLKGNKFTIKVYTDKTLSKRIPKKIPNYFGVQRFGKTRPITHLVGKEIVLGDFKEAVMIYLTQVDERERIEDKEARRKLRKMKDYKAALEYFPRHLGYERTLLGHLSMHPDDYIGALRKLPKYLKLMFIHAYQSYLFNIFLEQTIKKKLKLKQGPLYGYGLKLENALEKRVLKQENMSLEQFKIPQMPELSMKGQRRDLFIAVKDFKIKKKGKDFYLIQFSLPKGCYATTIIEHIFS